MCLMIFIHIPKYVDRPNSQHYHQRLTKSVTDNGTKKLLTNFDKKKKCVKPFCERDPLNIDFGLYHCKCTGHTSTKSGSIKSRYHS